MLEIESTEKFTPALTKCHSLTLHLLAHDWSKYHFNIQTWFCPLSHNITFWCRNNDLSCLDDRHQPLRCLNQNLCDFKFLKSGTFCHLHFESNDTNNSPYHKALNIYMEYCMRRSHKHIFFTVFAENDIGYSTPLVHPKNNDTQESLLNDLSCKKICMYDSALDDDGVT